MRFKYSIQEYLRETLSRIQQINYCSEATLIINE